MSLDLQKIQKKTVKLAIFLREKNPWIWVGISDSGHTPRQQIIWVLPGIDVESNKMAIIRWKFPFTNQLVVFVCREESITHNAERTSHSASAIVAKEILYQS